MPEENDLYLLGFSNILIAWVVYTRSDRSLKFIRFEYNAPEYNRFSVEQQHFLKVSKH